MSGTVRHLRQGEGKRVLISGWYGHGNVGDEAVLAGMSESLLSLDPNQDIGVLSGDPSATESMHGLKAWKRSRGPRGLARLPSEVWALLHYDGVVLGGGGLVKDWGGPGNCHAWLRLLQVAQNLSKPTMTYALGVDRIRYESSMAITRSVLSKVDVLTVRDDFSRTALEDVGVEREIVVTADPALLILPSDIPAPGDGPYIAVTVCKWRDEYAAGGRRPQEVQALRSMIAGALDALIEESGADIAFLPFRAHPEAPADNDWEESRQVQSMMKMKARTRVLEVPSSPSMASAVISNADFVVGMRLHSLILAAGNSVPFVAIEYMPKVRGFLAHLGRNNLGIGLDDELDPISICERVLNAYRAKEDTRTALERIGPILKSLAALNSSLALAAIRKDRNQISLLSSEGFRLRQLLVKSRS